MYQTSKDTYDKLEPIDPLIEEILAFDIKMKHFQKLSDSIVNLEYADEGIVNQNKVLKEYTGKYELLKDIDKDWLDTDAWYSKVITNIANSGFFDINRLIEDYCSKVWDIKDERKTSKAY